MAGKHPKTRQGEKSGFSKGTEQKGTRTDLVHLSSVFSSMLRQVLRGGRTDELYEQTARKKAEGSQHCRVND